MSNTITNASILNDSRQLVDHLTEKDWDAAYADLKALAGDFASYVNSAAGKVALGVVGADAAYRLGQNSWNKIVTQSTAGGVSSINAVDFLMSAPNVELVIIFLIQKSSKLIDFFDW
jgi:hypothetical protein